MKFFTHPIFIMIFLASVSLYAQTVTLYEDSLCEFTWQSDVNNCPDTIDCIYIDGSWNDHIFVVPFNITHIAKEGLEICLEDPQLNCKGITFRNETTNNPISTGQTRKINDTTWTVSLNKPVGLRPGLNQLYLNALFGEINSNEYDTTLEFRFYIDVTPDTPYTSECFECWYRTQIKVVEPNSNVGIDTLTMQNNQYEIQLEYYGSDTTIKEVNIIVKTTQKGDLDTFSIGNPSYDGVKYIFKQTVPFIVTTGNAIPGNGTTESDFSDIVSLYWQHPEEVLDTAFENIPVVPPTSTINQYVPLNQQQIKFIKQKKDQRNVLEIHFSNPIHYIEASLISPIGQEMSHCVGSKTQCLTLCIRNAANGIYFLKLSSGTQKLVRKVLLTR